MGEGWKEGGEERRVAKGLRRSGAQGEGAPWSGPGPGLAVTAPGSACGLAEAQAISVGFRGFVCCGINLLPFAWMHRSFWCLF